MNLKNYYYYFKSALPLNFVNDVLELGKSKQSEIALTGNFSNQKTEINKKQFKQLFKKRKSEVVFLRENWIYKELHPFLEEANFKAGWNFQYDFSEDCQFTKYGVGEHYGWHCDSWEEPYNHPQNNDGTYPRDHGKIRKLSMTVSLSNPDDYEGGNLEFDFRNSIDVEWKKGKTTKECTEIRPKGSLVIFPSFVWHRVKPVIKGNRYSLVVWTLGSPFK